MTSPDPNSSNRKTNKFYFFVFAYVGIFAGLAFFGAVEVTNIHNRKIHVSKVIMDQINAITKNKELYSLPRMEVLMPSTMGTHHRIRLGINLEIDKKDVDRFVDFQPRVSDRIVEFLDHEDFSNIEGPNGMRDLRNNILFEVNKVSGPIQVSDIIFREFIVR